MTSAVLIIPAALRDAANAVGDVMGWGPENYTIALSGGGETVTHYACRTDVAVSFLVILLAAGYDLTRAQLTAEAIAGLQATLDALAAAGQTPVVPPGAAMVLAALDVNLSDALWGADHERAVTEAKGLTRVW